MMADKKKTIQIPTLDEIEQFEQHKVVTPIFKKRQKIDEPEHSTEAQEKKQEDVGPAATSNVESTTALPTDPTDSTNTGNVQQQTTVAKATKHSNSILVSSKQQGNPILKHVRNVPWEFASIVPDYELGKNVCALFLSVRYHQQNPDYIHGRLKLLGKAYDVRVILMLVDSKEPHLAIKELARICILADCTLILAFSAEEAGRYLETYKVYEHKPADVLMEKSDDNYMARFTDCLTTVKSVNKTDCSTLLSTFGSFEKICEAEADDFALCPGVGPQKASRLYSVLHEPFLKSHKFADSVDPGLQT